MIVWTVFLIIVHLGNIPSLLYSNQNYLVVILWLIPFLLGCQTISLSTMPISSIACSFVVDIPLLFTSSGTQSGLAQGIFLSARRIAYFYQSKNALLLSESLFPTNGGFSGGKPKSCLLVIFRPFASSFRIF